ncbi:hypothetical protein [uncultured Photobacterium sp.]|uniref:hypothetical protein n=1 Tax=uncultured Photobacterium sp. TaxID=173973 RepID=UPI002603A704|nr:hypothetical protein [uncultured Photobacterium sp.]
MVTNDFHEKHEHEKIAVQMLDHFASKYTIESVLGYMPKLAEVERKRRGTKSKTRNGAHSHFLEASSVCWMITNRLWMSYAQITRDPYINRPLNPTAMLRSFEYVKMFHANVCDHVDFNRFYSVLKLICEKSIMLSNCSDCGSLYISKRTTIYRVCPCCDQMKRFD